MREGACIGQNWGCYYATALDIEVDPQRCYFGSCQSYFALQAVVECRAARLNRSASELFKLVAKYRARGHEYVTTSLLENAVILETIKKEGTLRWRPPHLPSFKGPRAMSVWEAP